MAVTFIGEGNRSVQRKPVASHRLYHMLHRVHLSWAGFELTTLVVTGTDCIDSCNSNYTTITTTMAPTRIVYRTHNGACSHLPHQTPEEIEIIWLCEQVITVLNKWQVISQQNIYKCIHANSTDLRGSLPIF